MITPMQATACVRRARCHADAGQRIRPPTNRQRLAQESTRARRMQRHARVVAAVARLDGGDPQRARDGGHAGRRARVGRRQQRDQHQQHHDRQVLRARRHRVRVGPSARCACGRCGPRCGPAGAVGAAPCAPACPGARAGSRCSLNDRLEPSRRGGAAAGPRDIKPLGARQREECTRPCGDCARSPPLAQRHACNRGAPRRARRPRPELPL